MTALEEDKEGLGEFHALGMLVLCRVNSAQRLLPGGVDHWDAPPTAGPRPLLSVTAVGPSTVSSARPLAARRRRDPIPPRLLAICFVGSANRRNRSGGTQSASSTQLLHPM
jgi:hypothetical protein